MLMQSATEMFAARTGRDPAAACRDAEALIQAGLLQRVDEQRIEFPHDTIKVEFLLRAA